MPLNRNALNDLLVLLRNYSAQLRLVQLPVKTSTVHIMGNPFDDLSRIIRVRYIYNKL